MEVRRIRADEGLRLRDLRLSALADAPMAFGTTLAEAQAQPQEYWEHFAREAASAETRLTFIVEENEQWYGMAGGFVAEDQPDSVHLVSMWVEPRRRGLGIGAALVEAVVQWAHGCGARRVYLWVVDTNHQAKSLYVRQGFAETAHARRLPSNPALREILMVRELS